MTGIIRYAVYLVPKGPLGEFGAAWLGWKIDVGQPAPQIDLARLPRPLAALTEQPRRYGFHATIKPPFRLAADQTPQALDNAMAALCAELRPIDCDGLALTDLDGFLALVPTGDTAALDAMAAQVVRRLDPFRAPAPETEMARRRAPGLSPAQEANLLRWGYPYVMDEFQCHFTLTGRLSPGESAVLRPVLGPHLNPHTGPFLVDSLCLVGEQASGGFRLLHRHALSG
jgi:hypothetical protein